jgi:short-subunit dehydrogenase
MNAAAIMPTERLLNQDAGLVNRIMAINYGGTVNVPQAVLPGLLQRGRGDLVNFASVAGWLPTLPFGAYNAFKFAVVAFKEVLHHENRNAAWTVWMRRHLPRLLWWNVHRVEGF